MIEPGSGRVPDRGQAIPVLLLVVAFVATLTVGVATWGAALIGRARVAAAADAAALAGVVHGIDTARAIAAANGAEVVRWSWDTAGDRSTGGRVLTVTVEVRSSLGALAATARASTRP